jgi:predicted MFS family arabinose efflux permease
MFSTAYKRYVLGTLTLVYTLNSLDSGLMILLLQPIKQDLHLSDSQLGFLTGIAFGLFYATLGLPIARWSDRGNRSTITAMAIGLWGLTVMACVFVTNFVQLVAARVAAGVGESGCMPATYSLVGDYFPKPAERTRAMTLYMLAGPLAPMVSFVLGGWLNEHYGWRAAFFAIGIPGLFFAVLTKLTVAEPRGKGGRPVSSERHMPRTTEVLAILWRQRSSRHLGIATILLFTMGLGLSPWYAAFMMRSHGMNTAELGLWLGLIFGAGGLAGTLLGGYAATRWFAQDERGQMRLSAIVLVALVPCFALFVLVPQKSQALIALTPLVMVANFTLGPTFALMQRLVADEMRATTMALVMFLANLIGMGVGPQTVGLLSDGLMPFFGSDSLRYAMLTVSLVTLWSAYHFWQVGRTVRADLAAVAGRSELQTPQSGAMVV